MLLFGTVGDLSLTSFLPEASALPSPTGPSPSAPIRPTPRRFIVVDTPTIDLAYFPSPGKVSFDISALVEAPLILLLGAKDLARCLAFDPASYPAEEEMAAVKERM